MLGLFQRPQVTILVVCTANVCRSPAAEALLRHHLRELGLHREIRVRSAGTHVGSPGRRPDPRMIELGIRAGISFRGIKAKPVTSGLLNWATYVWVMEGSHLQALSAKDAGLIKNVARLDPAGGDVPDPYYGSKSDVADTFQLIESLVYQRVQQLKTTAPN